MSLAVAFHSISQQPLSNAEKMEKKQTMIKTSELPDNNCSDDIATDRLYIDLGESSRSQILSQSNPDVEHCTRKVNEAIPVHKAKDIRSETDDVASSETFVTNRENMSISGDLSERMKPIPSRLPPSLISDYPPPYQPTFGVPLTTSGFHQFHPMLFPGMNSASPFLSYQPAVAQFERSSWSTDTPTTHIDEEKEQLTPSSDGRSSPADSVSSSGVSSSANPSPTRTSPEMSPQTPQKNTRPPAGRTCYTPQQVRAMEKAFSEVRYPDYDQLENISVDLGIPVKKIKVWFQNKRARKKSHLNFPVQSFQNMTAMASLPFPVHIQPMMPSYHHYTQYPVMFPSTMC